MVKANLVRQQKEGEAEEKEEEWGGYLDANDQDLQSSGLEFLVGCRRLTLVVFDGL